MRHVVLNNWFTYVQTPAVVHDLLKSFWWAPAIWKEKGYKWVNNLWPSKLVWCSSAPTYFFVATLWRAFWCLGLVWVCSVCSRSTWRCGKGLYGLLNCCAHYWINSTFFMGEKKKQNPADFLLLKCIHNVDISKQFLGVFFFFPWKISQTVLVWPC